MGRISLNLDYLPTISTVIFPHSRTPLVGVQFIITLSYVRGVLSLKIPLSSSANTCSEREILLVNRIKGISFSSRKFRPYDAPGTYLWDIVRVPSMSITKQYGCGGRVVDS